ncbi:ABC transporter, ATP-binding protein [Deferribacter desulfuricans SSM1]|uniref:ABC transporter, ATP-binding protein n=1 Tax=Deferribacter desulfuricans (strain DSM 14783 / JCM 11476 / NBRC 101012 / SSM1) TaxID=639282 RepID=D3P907_DEFDS|nr:ATP-binding cassette domain-containing protein [Deferribacter desulfuricans]BAI81197.1 ABC transporter, ATP-binding protein [Deferribacter desulfuricans SSM1]
MIYIRNLVKSYGDKRILEIGELSFSKGNIFSIYGRNGSGKTTLLNILGGVDFDFSGELIIDFKKIGYVIQFIENIICKRTIFEEVLSIVKDNDLAEVIIDNLELNDVKSMNPLFLSSGQKRLLFLYSVFLVNDLILIDEPFINLDKKSKKLVVELFQTFKKKGKCIIYTTNRLNDTKIANYILEIENGRIKKRDY